MYSSEKVAELIVEMIKHNVKREDLQEVIDYSVAVLDAEKAQKKVSILEKTGNVEMWMYYYHVIEDEA